jgi:hypothetical protein
MACTASVDRADASSVSCRPASDSFVTMRSSPELNSLSLSSFGRSCCARWSNSVSKLTDWPSHASTAAALSSSVWRRVSVGASSVSLAVASAASASGVEIRRYPFHASSSATKPPAAPASTNVRFRLGGAGGRCGLSRSTGDFRPLAAAAASAASGATSAASVVGVSTSSSSGTPRTGRESVAESCPAIRVASSPQYINGIAPAATPPCCESESSVRRNSPASAARSSSAFGSAASHTVRTSRSSSPAVAHTAACRPAIAEKTASAAAPASAERAARRPSSTHPNGSGTMRVSFSSAAIQTVRARSSALGPSPTARTRWGCS